MYFILKGHSFLYEVQTTIQIFYQNLTYTAVSEIQESGITIISTIADGFCTAIYYEDGKKLKEYKMKHNDEIKSSVKLSIFHLLKSIVACETPWGVMTGIRPAKKTREFLLLHSEDTVKKILSEKYLVRNDKVELSIKVAHAENKIIQNNHADMVSLYIGIPFCPTRCLYCSFTSYPIAKHQKKVQAYLGALFKELAYIAKSPYKIESIYIGGGTPTSLNESQLESLLQKINELFDVKSIKEFTVECGRPDTLNEKKLSLLKEYYVSRISINPQTLNQKTLDLIGREHTTEMFYEIFHLARQLGHDNINADLILGLPNETVTDVEYTLSKIQNLSPESLTVHTLAIKRASVLKEKFSAYRLTEFAEMEKMLSLVQTYTENMNLFPYYMYRQKNMTGNFENVGYAKEGYACIYNVQMMEETQTIISAGAGAVTKTVDLAQNRIERIFNVKDVTEYIARIDEMINRKRVIERD